MDAENIKRWAKVLYLADIEKHNVDRISATEENFDEETGYQIQSELIAMYRNAGVQFCGKKTGGISYGMETVGGFGPHYGYMMTHKIIKSGDEIDLCRMLSPGLEAEVTVHFSRDLCSAKPDDCTIIRSIDKLIPSWEIVESRIYREGKKLPDSLSDNAAFGGAVFGEPVEICGSGFAPIHVEVYKDGQKHSCNTGYITQESLCGAIRWLAGRLADHGDYIAAGDYILTGALTKPLFLLEAGDRYEARFSGLGTVCVRAR